jgi:phage shock protein E
MDTKLLVIFVVVDAIVFALVLFKVLGPVSQSKARELLQAGAKVIDVRSLAEFNSGHVRIALNIPGDEISRRIEAVVPDKSTPLLVHCLSGGRSAIAKGALRRMGYTQVHNLGSLSRARRIVEP